MATAFNDLIFSCYHPTYGSDGIGFKKVYYSLNTPIEDTPTFSKYMKVDLSKDEIEIPCIYRRIIMRRIKEIFEAVTEEGSNLYDTLYIPLVPIEDDHEKVAGSSPLIKKFFTKYHPPHNLIKKIAGDTTYLGGEGFIAYEDFTPLVMFTLLTKKVQEERELKLDIERQLVRINPIIFEKDDVVAKYIRGKFLANTLAVKNDCWIRRGLSCTYMDNFFSLFTSCALNYDFKIIIDDFSDFFISPSKPDGSFSDDKINEFLSEIKEDIVNNVT